MFSKNLFKKHTISVIGISNNTLDVYRVTYYGLDGQGVTHLMKIAAMESAREQGMDAIYCMDDTELTKLDEKLHCHHQSSPLETIFESVIQDWRLVNSVDPVPGQGGAKYKLRIEQNQDTGQVWFEVIDLDLSESLTAGTAAKPLGLFGVIDIRHGKPGISLGVNEKASRLHILADPIQGLHLYSDNLQDKPKVSSIPWYDSDMSIPSLLFMEPDQQKWLNDVRRLFCIREITNRFGKMSHELEFKIVGDNWLCRLFIPGVKGKIISISFFKKTYNIKTVNVRDVQYDA